MLKSVIILPLFITLLNFGFSGEDIDRCHPTKDGPAIDWSPNMKLTWTDFKSTNKINKGFSVALSTCGFGYDGLIQGNEISVNIYVRFYCNDSWRNPDFNALDVLEHEQLHFDICELYGRKLYKKIVGLRAKNQLTERNLNELYHMLVEEYDEIQDKYDEETNHSINTREQTDWNKYIATELNELSKYSAYTEY